MGSDRFGLTRVVDEFLWTLRRDGFALPTSQTIDVLRALEAVGIDDPWSVREAIASVVVDRLHLRPRFDAAFEDFFRVDSVRRSLWERLSSVGFLDHEINVLRELLERAATTSGDLHRLGGLLEGGAELDYLLQLAGLRRSLGAVRNALQAGFFAYRVLELAGVREANAALSRLATPLRDALGAERAGLLLDALQRELEQSTGALRAHVYRTAARRQEEAQTNDRERTSMTTPFLSLTDPEVEEVRLAVRSFADRLRGAARVRTKRAKRGRVDPHATLRRSLCTFGVPFAPVRRARRRDKPRLIILCDVSDSVRQAARFMLEFVYAVHELFDRTRSFVFVSELGETTDLFTREPVHVALAQAYAGAVVSVADNSNYGRVLCQFGASILPTIDRRTTVVVLGDGRTNYHADHAAVLDRIRSRARALLWLCPEEQSSWSLGDSAMPVYAPKCTAVLQVRTASELEQAGRTLVAGR